MHPLQSIMIIGVTAFLLTGALFLVIRKMPSKRGINWWLASMLTAALSYLMALVFFGKERILIGELFFFFSQLSVHIGIVIGTLSFFDKKINKTLYVLYFSIAIIIISITSFYKQKLLADMIFVAFISCYMFYLSIYLFKLPKKSKSTKTTATLSFLVGTHWLNYPFLITIEWLAPIGFLIGMILGMSMGLSLALLALLEFERQTKESEQKAIFASRHDTLTGLYNRSYLDALFDGYVAEAQSKNRDFILLYLDLDGFKAVNDIYGHKAGDFLLKTIAERLTSWLKNRGDIVRIGGDELIILSRMGSRGNTDHIYGAARRILDAIEKPIVDGEHTYHVSASIGVCCYPEHGEELESLLGRADELMYTAKKDGGKRIKFADFNYIKPRTNKVPTEVFA